MLKLFLVALGILGYVLKLVLLAFLAVAFKPLFLDALAFLFGKPMDLFALGLELLVRFYSVFLLLFILSKKVPLVLA